MLLFEVEGRGVAGRKWGLDERASEWSSAGSEGLMRNVSVSQSQVLGFQVWE